MLTMDQLKRKGSPLASRCLLCGRAKEDLHHLLIHCPKIWELWGALLSLSGIVWVCPLLARDLIIGWKAIPARKEERKIWLAAPSICFGQFGRKEIDWSLKMPISPFIN